MFFVSHFGSKVLTRLGVPLADGGRKLSVTRIVGGKGSSAIINGCAVKVSHLSIARSCRRGDAIPNRVVFLRL